MAGGINPLKLVFSGSLVCYGRNYSNSCNCPEQDDCIFHRNIFKNIKIKSITTGCCLLSLETVIPRGLRINRPKLVFSD